MEDLIDSILRNWSGLELAWSIMAVLGVVLSSRALARVTVLTMSALEDGMEWPTRRRLIKRVRDAAGAYFRHIGFLVIGIVAMAVPAPPPNPDIDTTPGLSVAVVLIGVIVWDIISLQWDERDWVGIVRALLRDPKLWQRVIQDEERVQAKIAAQMGEKLPHQEHASEGRTCLHGKDQGCA